MTEDRAVCRNVEELIDARPLTHAQWVVFVLCSLVMFGDGFLVVPYIARDWAIQLPVFSRPAGNTRLYGKMGAFATVRPNTAAIIPPQFGGSRKADLRPYVSSISGRLTDMVGGRTVTSSFNGITDVIDGMSPTPGVPVLDALQQVFLSTRSGGCFLSDMSGEGIMDWRRTTIGSNVRYRRVVHTWPILLVVTMHRSAAPYALDAAPCYLRRER